MTMIKAALMVMTNLMIMGGRRKLYLGECHRQATEPHPPAKAPTSTCTSDENGEISMSEFIAHMQRISTWDTYFVPAGSQALPQGELHAEGAHHPNKEEQDPNL